MLKIFGNETQQTISDWALATFGDVKTPRSILTRAGCEFAELVHAVECDAPHDKIVAEIADVIIVLCRYPADLALAEQSGAFICGAPGFLLSDAEESLTKAKQRTLDATNWPIAPLVIRLVDALSALVRRYDLDLPAAIDAKMMINRGRKWAAKGAGHGQHVAEPAAETCAFAARVKEREVLRLAAEYKAACATIAPALDDHAVAAPGESFAALRRYHAAITRAGNARRALLAYVSDDTPEVAPQTGASR